MSSKDPDVIQQTTRTLVFWIAFMWTWIRHRGATIEEVFRELWHNFDQFNGAQQLGIIAVLTIWTVPLIGFTIWASIIVALLGAWVIDTKILR